MKIARMIRHILSFGMAQAIQTACAQPASTDRPDRLHAFEAALSAQPSATKALAGWCAAHHLADPAIIVATPVAGKPAPAPADLRKRLAISRDAPIAYRHVRLSCGNTILSEAYNWYTPARLTPDMNTTLTTTDTPFGTVVAPLRFTREALTETGNSGHGGEISCPDGTILAHRALLHLPSGVPLAMVVECYTRANLAENSEK